MRNPWIVLMIGSFGFWTDPTCAKDGGPSRARSRVEERLQEAERALDETRSEGYSLELPSGNPGAGTGGDLFSSVLELFREPSGLWDFRPRKFLPSIPDRETAEFLRDRR